MAQGTSYINIGMIYNQKTDYTNALKHLNKARKLFKEIGDNKLLTITLNNMGTIYVTLGNLKQALSLHLEALKFAEKENYKLGIGNNLNSIGNI